MPTTQRRGRYKNVSSNFPEELWEKCVVRKGGGSAHLRKLIAAYEGDANIAAMIESTDRPAPEPAMHTIASVTNDQWAACKRHPGRSGAMHLRILASAYEANDNVRAAVDAYAQKQLL